MACPFRADQRRRELRDASPAEWADAVVFDRAIRAGHRRHGQPTLRGRAYLHRFLLPLDRAALRPTRARGRAGEPGDGLGNGCHRLCGT